MDDFKKRLQDRLMILVREVVEYTRNTPKGVEFYIIRKQLIRSVTSVGANYSAACRARSRSDYMHKLHIAEEECDESIYWIRLIEFLKPGRSPNHEALLNELNQVLSIIVATLKTLKGKE